MIAALALASGDLAMLEELPAERLSLAAPGANLLDLGEAWAIPILGSVMAPELVARVLAAKSPCGGAAPAWRPPACTSPWASSR